MCSSYFETSLYQKLFSKLSAKDIESIVYVPRWHEENEDLPHNVFVVSKRFSKLSKLIYWGEQRYILHDIEKRININKIDIIHVHRILYGGYVALKLKEKYNIPYIVAIRNSDLYGFGRNMSIYKRHCWNIINNASKVIFISEAYRENVTERYADREKKVIIREKSDVIPNGIDDYFINNIIALDSRSNPAIGYIRLISLGDIDENKNVLTTLKAIDILIAKGIKVTLKIAGIIRNESVFNILNNKAYVEYLGVLSKEQVRYELLSSDIFVMPSVHETFGLVYAEAMSQGLPIIYTRGQGFDGQYQEGEVGYSVDCYNAQEIADRILDIISNYVNISNRCVVNSQRYSWDKIAKRYNDIYEEVIKSSARVGTGAED